MTSERFKCRGQCRCDQCAPDAFPDPSTISPVSGCYFSVDRGHHVRNYPDLGVAIDGEWCRDITREALAGVDGWIIVYASDGDEARLGHLCENCRKGVCLLMVHGTVRVQLGVMA